MAFRPENFESGRVTLVPMSTGVTTVKGTAVVADSDGYYINASSGTATDIFFIATEAVTTTVDGQLVSCYRVDPSVRINADCDLAPAQTDVGTVVDLASGATLNPDASSNDLFYIDSIDLSGGAVGTTIRVWGHFVSGAPNA